jgi:hypothetical protein
MSGVETGHLSTYMESVLRKEENKMNIWGRLSAYIQFFSPAFHIIFKRKHSKNMIWSMFHILTCLA